MSYEEEVKKDIISTLIEKRRRDELESYLSVILELVELVEAELVEDIVKG